MMWKPAAVIFVRNNMVLSDTFLIRSEPFINRSNTWRIAKKDAKKQKQNNSDTKDDKLKMVVGTCWTSVTITRKIHQYYSERKLLRQSLSNCESFSLCPFAHSGQLRESPSFTSCSIEETFFMLQDHTLPSVCGSSLYCSNCLFTSARFQYLTWSVACRIKLKSIHLENNVNFLNLHVFFSFFILKTSKPTYFWLWQV